MKENLRKKHLRMHTMKQFVVHQTKKAKQRIEDTADHAAYDTEQESYAADTLEECLKNTGIAANEITRQNAVRHYARHKAKSGKDVQQGITYVPHTEQGNINPGTVQKRKQQLKKAMFKREILRSYVEQSTPGIASAGKRVKIYAHPAIQIRNRVIERAATTMKHIAGKGIRAAASLFVGASPVIAVIVVTTIFAGAIAAVFESPLGILLAGQSGDPNEITISSIVQETNLAFSEAISDEIQAHPECTEVNVNYSYEPGSSWKSDWPEVLAFFSVKTNLQAGQDVIHIDTLKKQQIQEVFWQMHQIESVVETIEVEVSSDEESIAVLQLASPLKKGTEEDNKETEPEITTIQKLTVTVSSKSVDELSVEMHFTQEQNEILAELLSAEVRPYLVSLVGTMTDGLLWPLPGYTRISTYFGVPDAFGRPGHKGIDIPAPEGTPILAAHSGTVVIANTSSSYGNQVLLDSGDGVSTRYAHMTHYAVTAGQLVSAGQVIGYVGSTGMSTGNHLHFEVIMNGQLVDPLTLIDMV